MDHKERWNWFSFDDFACGCGCDRNETDPVLIDMLDTARTFSGVPFIIDSGYRCPANNRNAKSTSNNHTSGQAADIRCTDGPTRMKIVEALIRAGFRRLGFHTGFIHADRMDQTHNKVRSFWPY